MTEQQSFTTRYALTFIFITMLVDTVGLGIIIPVTPQLITELTHEPLSAAARWGGLLFFLFALMQFFFSPVLGNLSDRYGRRPVLIGSLAVLGLDYFISGIAPTIAWLIAARVVAGITSSTYPTVNAYIADVTPPEKRAAGFGLTGAAFGIGFILGPAIGGLIGSHFGTRAPFFAAAAVAFANAAFGFFVLKESLPAHRRRAFDVTRANPFGALMAIRRYPMIYSLLGVLILGQLAHDSLPATWTFVVIEKFRWTPAEVGYSLMAVGLLTSFSFALLPRIVVPRIGETNAVYIGLFFGALGYAGYAFSSQAWMIYAWMVVWALAGVGSPALNSILSKQVPASEQGELQGAIASMTSATSVFAPLVMTGLFSYFSSAMAPVYFPGAPFLAAGVCELVSLLIFFAVHNRLRIAPVGATE
jgi:DHA1 family tetracycline resistance protein-like MFS transporter